MLNRFVRYCGRGSFSTSSSSLAKSYKLLVVGGGSGGCSTAAKFVSKLGVGNVGIIEPRSDHYYQPLWTLVGGGQAMFEDSQRSMKSVLPKGADWIKSKVFEFLPEQNKVITADGEEISYEFLVIAMGLQLNYDKVKGLQDALETPGVGSNYHPDHVKKTWAALQNFKSGNAIFTFPNTPIKCAGAPQKIMYLADQILRKEGKRNDAQISYYTSLPVIFGVKKYADALWKVVEERDIKINLRHNLVEIRPDSKEALFQNLDCPENITTVKYEMIHVTPPMSAPDILSKHKSLTDASGYLNVDKMTLQHVDYHNIFGIGDCTNVPTSKTAAAVAGQLGVLRKNLTNAINGKNFESKYDGYTSCPLVIGPGQCILAEFDFNSPPQPLETFPYNQGNARWEFYVMKKHVMPRLYWIMLKGYWEGPKYVRKLLHLGMSK